MQSLITTDRHPQTEEFLRATNVRTDTPLQYFCDINLYRLPDTQTDLTTKEWGKLRMDIEKINQYLKTGIHESIPADTNTFLKIYMDVDYYREEAVKQRYCLNWIKSWELWEKSVLEQRRINALIYLGSIHPRYEIVTPRELRGLIRLQGNYQMTSQLIVRSRIE